MSQPLWRVRHVATEENLPEKLKRGVAYFVQDQQYIIVDMGDGRGPVKYGDKPGPAGIAGEPQPYIQEQLDDLAHASLRTTITIYGIARSTQAYMNTIVDALNQNFEYLMEQDTANAEAIVTTMKTLHTRIQQYDSALTIMAKNIANLYPHDWGKDDDDDSGGDDKGGDDKGEDDGKKDEIAPLKAGEVLLSDGTLFCIDSCETDGDTNIVKLTIYDTEKINTLKVGDRVQLDEGYFTVDEIGHDDTGQSITITLHEE